MLDETNERTSGPNTQSPNSNHLDSPRTSFSAIGQPVAESPTAANGVAPPRPVAEVRANPLRPPAPRAPAAAIPVSPRVAPNSPLAAATVPPVIKKAKKRRTGFLVMLALLTVLASGAVSYMVATQVSNDTAASTPVAMPTAASPATAAASESAEASAVESVDVEIVADEPFAVAAEIIRPSVVQLNLQTGLGTGFIINENGTILTAAHVIGDANEVSVTFHDGSSTQGIVVGTHEATDVAVVQVDPTGRDLTVAQLADGNDVRVGQIAVAVGSPFGFDQTVTAGIVSAVDRIVNGVSMVQTDASINPGNSGGPLINLNGEVIGINDLIFTESGTSAGVGFAISIDLAEIIADQLIQGVEPQIALLGVSTGVPADGGRGALVDRVDPGSAAAQAGLQPGDVVLSLDGQAIRGSADLRASVIDREPGSDIVIGITRGGEALELTATLGSTG